MLQERQVTSYLILRRNSLNTYLKNFDIAHDIFNYDITYSDVDLLKTYYEEKKNYRDAVDSVYNPCWHFVQKKGRVYCSRGNCFF